MLVQPARVPRHRESESRVLPVTRSIGGLSVDRSRLSPHAILFSETGSGTPVGEHPRYREDAQ